MTDSLHTDIQKEREKLADEIARQVAERRTIDHNVALTFYPSDWDVIEAALRTPVPVLRSVDDRDEREDAFADAVNDALEYLELHNGHGRKADARRMIGMAFQEYVAGTPVPVASQSADTLELLDGLLFQHADAAQEWESAKAGSTVEKHAEYRMERVAKAIRTLFASRPVDAEADDDLEWAWGIIANAHGGTWTDAHPDWQKAAANWRDRVMPKLSQRSASREASPVPEPLPVVREPDGWLVRWRIPMDTRPNGMMEWCYSTIMQEADARRHADYLLQQNVEVQMGSIEFSGFDTFFGTPPSSPDTTQPEVCEWRKDDDAFTYETACGDVWVSDGTPEADGLTICNHCRKPLRVVESQEEKQ